MVQKNTDKNIIEIFTYKKIYTKKKKETEIPKNDGVENM